MQCTSAQSWPLSRHIPWGWSGLDSGRGITTLSTVARTSFMSWRLAPSTSLFTGSEGTGLLQPQRRSYPSTASTTTTGCRRESPAGIRSPSCVNHGAELVSGIFEMPIGQRNLQLVVLARQYERKPALFNRQAATSDVCGDQFADDNRKGRSTYAGAKAPSQGDQRERRKEP